MKELFTDITLRNGEVKKIKVELEDELAEWLVTQPEEVYRGFLIFEYARADTYFICLVGSTERYGYSHETT